MKRSCLYRESTFYCHEKSASYSQGKEKWSIFDGFELMTFFMPQFSLPPTDFMNETRCHIAEIRLIRNSHTVHKYIGFPLYHRSPLFSRAQQNHRIMNGRRIDRWSSMKSKKNPENDFFISFITSLSHTQQQLLLIVWKLGIIYYRSSSIEWNINICRMKIASNWIQSP